MRPHYTISDVELVEWDSVNGDGIYIAQKTIHAPAGTHVVSVTPLGETDGTDLQVEQAVFPMEVAGTSYASVSARAYLTNGQTVGIRATVVSI